MAQRLDVARGQEILDRWCALAEQRLDHLTELFETGRWRRYYTERSFLENIQEAKRAVETWRRLASREASPDNLAIDLSWLNSSKPVPPRRNPLSGYYFPPSPRRAEARIAPEIIEAPIVPQMSAEISPSVMALAIPQAMPQHMVSDQSIPESAASAQMVSQTIAPASAIDNSWQQALDLSAMQERYPLLRNAL